MKSLWRTIVASCPGTTHHATTMSMTPRRVMASHFFGTRHGPAPRGRESSRSPPTVPRRPQSGPSLTPLPEPQRPSPRLRECYRMNPEFRRALAQVGPCATSLGPEVTLYGLPMYHARSRRGTSGRGRRAAAPATGCTSRCSHTSQISIAWQRSWQPTACNHRCIACTPTSHKSAFQHNVPTRSHHDLRYATIAVHRDS